jgi:hypothetical protein
MGRGLLDAMSLKADVITRPASPDVLVRLMKRHLTVIIASGCIELGSGHGAQHAEKERALTL